VPADSTLKLESLADLAQPDLQRLALTAEAAPNGRYARQALRKVGVWDRLAGRILDGSDVRATLTYVSRGEADAGIVYATDAAQTQKVRVALKASAELHEPIRYPLVLVRRDRIKPQARRLYDYLAGEAAAAVFRRAGFQMTP
jgi:molybdate transport system substrate-binding protein